VVTEFTDHICVTMDAELIMFLHDLVSAYLKEKEKGRLCVVIFFFQATEQVAVNVIDSCQCHLCEFLWSSY
jgi:hypothetical protein